MKTTRRALGALAALALMSAPAFAKEPKPFTIAVIPDTQNYVDYTHQKAAGFPFDASEMFLEQMDYIRSRLKSQGGDIVFVDTVGDVWQHQTKAFDEEHAKLGLSQAPNPIFDKEFAPTEEVRRVEMTAAKKGYEKIAGLTPFGVVPGNHDYDAMWTDSRYPPAADFRNPPKDNPRPYGMLHPGGLDNFREVFGAQSDFFRGKPWYVGSYNGGASSAQIFTAGGYRFLHIGLEMSPADDVLAWASSVIAAHPRLPTMISTHDYLDTQGRRLANPVIDLALIHPEHNNAEDLWKEFISKHDQIFLVLCGHQHAQSRRVDMNDFGHEVHQILADYQDRNLTAKAAGVNSPLARIGDGWFRLMTYDLGTEPKIRVRTYSARYKAFSSDLPNYAAWYRKSEQPQMTDAEFMAADDFVLPLPDFRKRFGAPKAAFIK
jgi:hypothetical protein